MGIIPIEELDRNDPNFDHICFPCAAIEYNSGHAEVDSGTILCG